MAWTFRRRKKLFPGVRLNYGSSGLSLNVGVPGASLTVGANGVYANTGIPGTGFRSRRKIASATSFENSDDVQVTEKDIKRAVRFRNVLYFFAYVFSYLFIIALWILTGVSYSPDDYLFLLPGFFCLFFIINTFRLHLHHRRANIDSKYTFAIIDSILLILVSLLAGIIFYTESTPIGWSLCLMLSCLFASNLFFCFKYRVKPPKKQNSKPAFVYNDGTTSEEHYSQLQERIAAQTTTQTASAPKQPVQSTVSKPIVKPYIPEPVDYSKKDFLYFSQSRVREDLERFYSPDTINVCEYIVNSQKCVLSDIQAELGISYQKVLEAVKTLEKAYIVKQDGARRRVLVSDDTVAIRLLMRHAQNQHG